MIRVIGFVLFTCLMPMLAFGQNVHVEQSIGRCVLFDFGPTVIPNLTYELSFQMTNPDQVLDDFVIAVGFVMTDAAVLAEPTVTYHNGFETLFGATPQFVVEHHGDTVVAAISVSAAGPGQGLPVSAEKVTYFGLNFVAPGYGSDGAYLQVDTTTSVAFGGLQVGGGGSITWGGPSWYRVFQPPNCGTEITNNPMSPLQATMCVPRNYQFTATSCLGDSALIGFHLAYGPGQIDQATGQYTWTPGPGDAGTTRTIGVQVDAVPCDAYPFSWFDSPVDIDITVVGANNSPQFVPGAPNVFVVATGEDLVIEPQVEDPDACTDYRYSYYWFTPQDPQPPGWLDTLSGAFHFEPAPADTGVYYFNLVVNEGGTGDTAGYYVYYYDSFICGDINHISGINVSDLTWLVGYLFQGGPSPVTVEAGDVDCQPGVNVSDLTYVVAFLFQGGAAPCAQCP